MADKLIEVTPENFEIISNGFERTDASVKWAEEVGMIFYQYDGATPRVIEIGMYLSWPKGKPFSFVTAEEAFASKEPGDGERWKSNQGIKELDEYLSESNWNTGDDTPTCEAALACIKSYEENERENQEHDVNDLETVLGITFLAMILSDGHVPTTDEEIASATKRLQNLMPVIQSFHKRWGDMPVKIEIKKGKDGESNEG